MTAARAGLDWSPVWQFHSDPTPGNPERIDAFARQFANAAAKLTDAADRLQRLDTSDTVSEAYDAVVRKGVKVAKSLDAFAERYTIASDALGRYSVSLRQCQATTLTALQVGVAAKRQADAATMEMMRFDGLAAAEQNPAFKEQAQGESLKHNVRQNQALAQQYAAQARVMKAVAMRDDAGVSAQTRIMRYIDEDWGRKPVKKPSWWERRKKEINAAAKKAKQVVGDVAGAVVDRVKDIGSGIKSAAKFVWDNIDTIGAVIGVAAAALAAVAAAPLAAAVLGVLATALAVGSAWKHRDELIANGKSFVKAMKRGDLKAAAAAAGDILIVVVTNKIGGRALRNVAKKVDGKLGISTNLGAGGPHRNPNVPHTQPGLGGTNRPQVPGASAHTPGQSGNKAGGVGPVGGSPGGGSTGGRHPGEQGQQPHRPPKNDAEPAAAGIGGKPSNDATAGADAIGRQPVVPAQPSQPVWRPNGLGPVVIPPLFSNGLGGLLWRPGWMG